MYLANLCSQVFLRSRRNLEEPQQRAPEIMLALLLPPESLRYRDNREHEAFLPVP